MQPANTPFISINKPIFSQLILNTVKLAELYDAQLIILAILSAAD
jgi:hypothetical protein